MNKKDWTGNSTTNVCLGSSIYSNHGRDEHDYYATDPAAIDYLFEVENFSNNIWECACGEGNLSKRMVEYDKNVYCSDLIKRNDNVTQLDFLQNEKVYNADIITNPPYKYAQEFIEKAMVSIPNGRKVAMFLRLQFLESKKRYKMFKKYPPKKIYVFSGRMGCAMNNDFTLHSQSAVPYAWYVWEVGYTGKTEVDWIFVEKNKFKK